MTSTANPTADGIQLLTVTEIAELLRCDDQVIAKALNDGRLPGLKLGRSWLVPRDALAKRLPELAIEEAERRRRVFSPGENPTQSPISPSGATGALPSAPRATGRKAARVPPALPPLPQTA